MASIINTNVTKPATRTYPVISKYVTPNDFKQAYRAAKAGKPARLFEILRYFYDMDDEIPGAMQSLKSAITGNGFTLLPDPDEGALAEQQAQVFEAIFSRMDMIALVDELLDGHYFGFQAVSIPPEAWSTETIDGKTYQVPTTYELLPLNWLEAKKENRSDDTNTLFLGSAPYHSYAKGAVMLYTQQKLPSYSDIDFTRFGVGLACIRFAVFKYFNEEDAAAFNEVFATPMIVGKVGPGGKDAVVKKAVMEAGNDSRAVIGENDSIEFPQSNQSGSVDAFDRSAERWNKAIAKIIKSETLTDNMGSAGSYAAMYTTNGIRKDVATRLKRQVMQVIIRHFMQPIAELNWAGKLLVTPDLFIEGVEDEYMRAKVFAEANKLVPLSEQQIRKDLGLEAPEDEQDTVGVKSTGGTLF